MSKTSEIFKLTCRPYNHPYQGQYARLLFVCSAGLLRSATAANYFAKLGCNTRSCGSEEYALIPLSINLISWADKIYFMKKENFESVLETFKEQDGEVINILKSKAKVLDIPDDFEYNNPELIKLLDERVKW